jgi:dTDP-4-amino-4,6-dideoxygalactose transaminase
VIPFIRPTVPEPAAWLPFLAASYASRIHSNFGPVTRRFEAELGAFAGGSREVVTAANATVGLVASLAALGVQGRVAVPSFTFPATGQAVLLAGCTPMFCDVSPTSWELDPEQLEDRLRSQPAAAILHVRAFGFSRELSDLASLARSRDLPLIVDAAAALGGRAPDGLPVGRDGRLEVFSLHATKVFNVGEGAAIFSSASDAAAIRSVLNCGIDGDDVTRLGINGKLSEVQAAIGLAVLEQLETFVARRREIAARYRAFFRRRAGWHTPADIGDPPWQTFPVLAPASIDLGSLLGRLRAMGLEARRYYRPALHRARVFARFSEGALPVTERLSDHVVCLPVFSDLSDSEYEKIESILRRVL